jgi:HEAT repeats
VPALGRSLTAVGAVLCYFLLNSTVSWAADEVGRLIDVLGEARSFKVRVQAITVLARLRDSRIAPALGRSALSDRHNYVRLYALRTLVKLTRDEPANERTRSVLQRAQRDRRSEVRREAARLMAELASRQSAPRTQPSPAPGPVVVAVGSISDRTGRARPQLRLQMRNALIGNLRSVRQLSVMSSLAIDARPNYVVDGSIARLTHGQSGTDMETACAVQLVISRPPRGIVMVVSGEAAVLRPRSQYRPPMRDAMESEALEHAVASAHENISRFLSAR